MDFRFFCILIFILPILFGADAIWFTMPITETIVAIYVIIKIKEFNLKLKNAS